MLGCCLLMFTCGILPEMVDLGNGDIETPAPEVGDFANTTFDYWKHQPLHPANNRPVTFQLKAGQSIGIRRVELSIYEYELTTDADGLPAKKKRANGVWGLQKTWEMAPSEREVQLEFVLQKGFPARSNIEYVFNVMDIDGNISGKMAQFDAGDSPWEYDKILLYATTRKPMKERLNVCFFMDTDYQNNWPLFLEDITGLIYDGYHENNMIEQDKDMWGFYYTKQVGDGKGISADCFNESKYPVFVTDSIIDGIDAFGLIHREEYSDGAYMYGNLTYMAHNMFTSEFYNYGTAIHETGHAIFRLNDEYQGCICFEAGKESNVFSKKSDCQAFNRLNGFPPEDCTELTHGNGTKWYLSERYALFSTEEKCESFNRDNGFPESECSAIIELDNKMWYKSLQGTCIMHDDGNVRVPDFQRTCIAIISYYYDQLRGISSQPIAQNTRMDNIFGYEPVIDIVQILDGNGATTTVQDVRYGIPTKNIAGTKPGSNLRQTRETYRVHSPASNQVIVHRPNQKDEIMYAAKTSRRLSAPYNSRLAKVVIEGDEKAIKALVPASINTKFDNLFSPRK